MILWSEDIILLFKKCSEFSEMMNICKVRF